MESAECSKWLPREVNGRRWVNEVSEGERGSR